jgi:hypothetical protein
VLTGQWIKKVYGGYIYYIGILFSHKKKETLPFAAV